MFLKEREELTVEEVGQLSFGAAGRHHRAPGERGRQRETAEKGTENRTETQSNHFLSRIRLFSVGCVTYRSLFQTLLSGPGLICIYRIYRIYSDDDIN